MTKADQACASCGGASFEDGHVVWNAPLRFKRPDESSFRRGRKVAARACTACGHIELYVEETRS